MILCPTRELAKQTQRECIRLSEGRGFRIHVISKIKKALTQYGSKSSQKFGNLYFLIVLLHIVNPYRLVDITFRVRQVYNILQSPNTIKAYGVNVQKYLH